MALLKEQSSLGELVQRAEQPGFSAGRQLVLALFLLISFTAACEAVFLLNRSLARRLGSTAAGADRVWASHPAGVGPTVRCWPVSHATSQHMSQ